MRCIYITMPPATVPTGAKSLKDKRNRGTGTWKDSMGLNAESTDWGKVGGALFISLIMTVLWAVASADLIYYSTRPMGANAVNTDLDYYFPDDMTKYPYFMRLPSKNNWKVDWERDGIRNPPIFEGVVEMAMEFWLGLGSILTGGGSKSSDKPMKGGNNAGKVMKGGKGDDGFYTCKRGPGAVEIDSNEPHSNVVEFPYSFAGGYADMLSNGDGYGTASPTVAFGYVTAQMFSMGRSWVKWFFDAIRPFVAGGGNGQVWVIMFTGLIMLYLQLSGVLLWMGVTLVCVFRALVARSSQYVGPAQEVWKMARISRIKYWSLWYLSYLVPLGLTVWGGPFLSAFMVAKLTWDVFIGPLIRENSRNTVKNIISCNAPWLMVVFGALFLMNSANYMDPLTWLGMGGIYGICTLVTIWHWWTKS